MWWFSSLWAARLLALLLPESLLAISLLISTAVRTGSEGGGAGRAVPADAGWKPGRQAGCGNHRAIFYHFYQFECDSVVSEGPCLGSRCCVAMYTGSVPILMAFPLSGSGSGHTWASSGGRCGRGLWLPGPIRPLPGPLPLRSGWRARAGQLGQSSLHLWALSGARSSSHALASFSFGLRPVAASRGLTTLCYTTPVLGQPDHTETSMILSCRQIQWNILPFYLMLQDHCLCRALLS